MLDRISRLSSFRAGTVLVLVLPVVAGTDILVKASAGMSCGHTNFGYTDPAVTTANGGVGVRTALDCQNKCLSNSACGLFTYYASSGGCWLQRKGLSGVDIPGVVSGPDVCEAASHELPTWVVVLTVVLVVALVLSSCFMMCKCLCGSAFKGRSVEVEEDSDSDSDQEETQAEDVPPPAKPRSAAVPLNHPTGQARVFVPAAGTTNYVGLPPLPPLRY